MGLFDKLAGGLVSGGKRGWLDGSGNPFIHTLHLKGVTDPLDPSPLWSSEFGGGAAICEAATGRGDRRLREALDAHRFVGSLEDEFGRVREDRRVFTDVLIRVPDSAWQGARFNHSVRIMQDDLTRRHEEDFQDHLLDARAPRYVILPEATLADDEVLCQFGLGVFLPDAEDRPIGEVQVCICDRSEPLPPWWNYDIGTGVRERVERPAALYRGQKYLLISNSPWQGAIQSPLWPAEASGYAVLHCDNGRYSAEWARCEPVTAAIEGNGQSGRFKAIFTAGAEARQRLTLAVELKAAALAATPEGADRTLIFTGEVIGPRLSLTALALPRISANAAAGLTGWTLRLNRDGTLDETASGGVFIQGKTGDDGLYWGRPGERRPARIKPSTQRLDWRPGVDPLEIIRSFQADYLCLLKLPKPHAYPLPPVSDGSGVVIGVNPAGDEVGIPLRALSQPHSLDGREQGVLNDLVSRRFARLTPVEAGLKVELLSANHPIHVLDRNYHHKETLKNHSDSLLLRPGEHLQLALYILRYDA
ncbi:MAG: hypothetical protein KJ558_15495 [Gammaproteobacteria bacterium]|nr:hypothetical protein [Gammaproteobacteria bacterium]MBU1656192.1 hypothetical protein [Gammaproteobacteria bacterium]MBU1960480.1 hypothetical protein [Gammaproteobacteria bacterium]